MSRAPHPAWDAYCMVQGAEFLQFWGQLLALEDRRLLYILGCGFDPRMCLGLKTLLSVGGNCGLNVLLVGYEEGPNSPSRDYDEMVQQNVLELELMAKGRASVDKKSVRMWAYDGTRRRRTSSVASMKLFGGTEDLRAYTDVVVDISALPRSIYLSLIGKLIYLLQDVHQQNLHVIVAEDATLDRQIVEVGVDESAGYIHGFGGGLDLAASGEIPTILIPILGEAQHDQLQRIRSLVEPEEICPVLPFPSRNPRRGDDLMMAYRELLFDQWRVEPRNIIYASELNPFDAYRQIYRVALRYKKVLSPLGGCRIALASLSSKLISLGALLAAHELKAMGESVGLANVEAEGYRIAGILEPTSTNLYSLWLTGECYER